MKAYTGMLPKVICEGCVELCHMSDLLEKKNQIYLEKETDK